MASLAGSSTPSHPPSTIEKVNMSKHKKTEELDVSPSPTTEPDPSIDIETEPVLDEPAAETDREWLARMITAKRAELAELIGRYNDLGEDT